MWKKLIDQMEVAAVCRAVRLIQAVVVVVLAVGLS
jgi:hypothetical protein